MIKRVFVVMLSIGLCASISDAALTATGDVDPPDPATWTSETDARIGQTGVGSVAVDDGSDLLSNYAYLGDEADSEGTVTVTGAGSTWTSSNHLYIGYSGDGTLDITGGGAVSSNWTNGSSCIGYESGATGAVTVSGVGSTLTNLCGLQVGRYGDGEIHVTNGASVTCRTTTDIGEETGSTGLVTISGPGSTWDVASIGVGRHGNGTLNIAAGGAVRSNQGRIGLDTGGTAVATVTGAGSTWDTKTLSIHDGALNITNGGAVTTTLLSQGVEIGHQPGTVGVVTVSGPGSTWTVTSWVGTGFYGSGTLNITDGGAVSNMIGFIADESSAAGDVTVDGAGSTWTSTDGLYVGYGAYGTLSITNGGAVSSCGDPGIGSSYVMGSIGFKSDATGEVLVSGTGSTWTNYEDTYVGYSGDGTLTITDGGAVSNTQGYIGLEAGSTGAVTVSGSGSTWTTAESLNVGYGGDATLDITDGGVVIDTYGLVNCSPGGSSGAVTVSGAGSTWTNSIGLLVGLSGSGTLRLGDGGTASTAIAAFDPGATLEFGLSGAASESRLTATGLATLAGELNVALLNGYLPTLGSEFLVVDAGSLSGTFDTFSFPNAQEWYVDYDTVAGDVSVGLAGWSPGNFDGDTDIDDIDIDLLGDAIRTGSADFDTFDITADGTAGGADGVIDILDLDYLVRFLVDTTTGHGTEYGDFNLDGMVDITDLTRLATDYGSGDTWAKGNASRYIDLITDTTDLTILATYYGFGVPDAVPEPATLSLLAIGAVAALARRRR